MKKEIIYLSIIVAIITLHICSVNKMHSNSLESQLNRMYYKYCIEKCYNFIDTGNQKEYENSFKEAKRATFIADSLTAKRYFYFF